jgi:transcriptional regulator with XRE-family HTH domain
MPKQSAFKKTHKRRPIFFREWREYRNLTQEKLADRIGTTKTRVSMKENQEEPYDQDYLEALATALQTDPASLLMRDPNEGEGMWSIWERAKPGERELIERVVRSIPVAKTGS